MAKATCTENVQLRAENDRLRDLQAEIDAAYRKTLDDAGAPDEMHCSCVPHLRRRIAELEAERTAVLSELHAAPDCDAVALARRYMENYANMELQVDVRRGEEAKAKLLWAEVEKLRAALEQYANEDNWQVGLRCERCGQYAGDDFGPCVWVDMEPGYTVARAALAGKEG